MNKLKTLEDVDQSGLLLYKYIRGSHAYGLNTETSDIDTGGVFSMPLETLIGTRYDYVDQVSDEKSDNVYYELEKFVRLLGISNPNMLESLFIPERCILYEHPAIKIIKDEREKFLTKRSFKAYWGFASSQIKKARGLNKMITKPITKRRDIMDFCYTSYKQGSTNIKNWLAYRNLKQEYCGCVNVPNMPNTVAVYYDWKHYFQDHDYNTQLMISEQVVPEDFDSQAKIVSTLKSLSESGKEMPSRDSDNQEIQKLYLYMEILQLREMFSIIRKIAEKSGITLDDWYKKLMTREEDYMYRGIMNPDETNNELRYSSVAKDEEPICQMTFNSNGYSEHCADYKKQLEWEKNRNPVRYESNLNKSYDSKNMMHCFRLIHMCIEVATGQGFKCDRSGIDREFLLDVKNHKFEYEELMERLDKLSLQMDDAIANSTLPDDIDPEWLSQLCIKVREAIWKDVEDKKSVKNS